MHKRLVPCSGRASQRFSNWRRERDSNPRAPFSANGFQDRRFQPLTHPSGSWQSVAWLHCNRKFQPHCELLVAGGSRFLHKQHDDNATEADVDTLTACVILKFYWAGSPDVFRSQIQDFPLQRCWAQSQKGDSSRHPDHSGTLPMRSRGGRNLQKGTDD